MCFAPQRRALFRHLNFQKWSENGVFCTFWLRNVLRATTACTFSTSQLPKVVREWCVLYSLTWKCALRHNGVQLFISHLASWLRTRRFSEPTFRPSGATNQWKNTVFRDFPTFSRICIFFLLTLSLLLFSLLIFLFSLPLPYSAFHLSILSEVWLLNFLRKLITRVMSARNSVVGLVFSPKKWLPRPAGPDQHTTKMAFAMEQNEFSYGIQDPMTEVLEQKKAKLSNMFTTFRWMSYWKHLFSRWNMWISAISSCGSNGHIPSGAWPPGGRAWKWPMCTVHGSPTQTWNSAISFTKGVRFKFHQISASLGRVPILYKHETTYLPLPLKICNLGPCGLTKKPKTAMVPP